MKKAKKRPAKKQVKPDPLGVVRGQNAEAVATVNPRNTAKPGKPAH